MSPTPRPRFELMKETDTRRSVIGKFNSSRDLEAQMEIEIKKRPLLTPTGPTSALAFGENEFGRDRRGYICTDVVTLRQ